MLAKKTAVVTGGSRSIGFSIAQMLVDLGYKVVICSRTTPEIKAALKLLNTNNQVAFGIKTDVSQFSSCQRLFEFAERKLGSVEVLINNAGIYGPIGPIEENSSKFWLQTIKINLLGSVYCAQLAIPLMKQNNSGRIINLCGAGVGGKNPLARFSAYYTSKTAIAGLTEVLAEELKPHNIQVNCIAPGAVISSFTDYLISQGADKAGDAVYQKAILQKETGGDSPKLAANLVSFLISDKAKKLTGCLISAKWDSPKDLRRDNISPNLYKLRRIDLSNFPEKI